MSNRFKITEKPPVCQGIWNHITIESIFLDLASHANIKSLAFTCCDFSAIWTVPRGSFNSENSERVYLSSCCLKLTHFHGQLKSQIYCAKIAFKLHFKSQSPCLHTQLKSPCANARKHNHITENVRRKAFQPSLFGEEPLFLFRTFFSLSLSLHSLLIFWTIITSHPALIDNTLN